MSKKKSNKENPLITIKCKYNGSGRSPRIIQVDQEGNRIASPHVEISKSDRFGLRKYEMKIYKIGRYKYEGVQKDSDLFYKFNGTTSGFFNLDEKGGFTLESSDVFITKPIDSNTNDLTAN